MAVIVFTLPAAAIFCGVGVVRLKQEIARGDIEPVTVQGASKLKGRTLIEEAELRKFRARLDREVAALGARRRRDATARETAAGAAR